MNTFKENATVVSVHGAWADGSSWSRVIGHELLTLNGHRSGVFSLAFSPDSLRIVTWGGDNTAKVWEAARQQQVTQWQAEESRKAQAP